MTTMKNSTNEIIDLTMDSKETNKSSCSKPSVNNHLGGNHVINVDDDDDVEDGDDTKDDNDMMYHLGSISCNVVGIKYYTGVAHPGEYVKLVREPNNPYDRNAIRVDNIRNDKVGHIKATTAYTLAPIIDQFIRNDTPSKSTPNDKASIYMDGMIGLQGANSYTLPLTLQFYSHSRNKYLSDFGILHDAMQSISSSWKPDKTLLKELRNKENVLGESTSGYDIEVTNRNFSWESAQENLDQMFDQLVQDQLTNLPSIEMPNTIVTPLLDHQIEGIRWLYHHETMYDDPEKQDISNSTSTTTSSAASSTIVPFYKKIQERGQTMWLSEITNATQPDPPKRISGSILADDMGLGKSLQALGLILTNPPKAMGPKTTLVICPVSVMSNWVMQIEQHIAPNTMKVEMYHGTDRINMLKTMSNVDVVVTSYSTIVTDYSNNFPKGNDTGNGNGKKKAKPPPKKKKKDKCDSIFDQHFHRIILDEAHTIRNVKSLTYAGCMALQATHRLCLTGTPLQNKPEDIHSLLSFLSVEPLDDRSIFRRAIAQPIYIGDPIGLSRLRTIMAHVALRRNKSKLNLVSKTVEIRSITFPNDCLHKKIHDTLFESAQIVFRATLSAVDERNVIKNYMKILEILMRIRQACISGKLVPKERIQAAEDVLKLVANGKALSAEDGEKLLEKLRGAISDTTECAICFDVMNETEALILRTCSHVFCETCLSKVSEQRNGSCPLCRRPFEPRDMIKSNVALEASLKGKNDALVGDMIDDIDHSPKFKALALAINEMQHDEKGVIFSQFTKLLDLLEVFLKSNGQSFVRIDGSKTAAQRITAMKEFNSESGGPRFILCSLHAAGTGITLTRGNHCFMMDTWWNSSVEQQAMDRIHRIGQKRPVRVIRFIMKDSIEERMINLQEAKAAIGKGSMEKLKPEEVRKARIGDLKSLFSIKG